METFFDTDKILSRGQLTLELIRKAWLEMGKKRVNPNCDPGFLRQQLPDQAP
jgi:glutamate/tyrosine decarboxylase-like PLP-dependent enzyme